MRLLKDFSLRKKSETTFIKIDGAYERKTIYSPAEGKWMALSEVPDEVFASKALGDGIAIFPSIGKLYSPVNGKVTALFPTNHAVGMISEDGMEILLHIGIDTVTMNGDGFQSYVTNDTDVKAGQLLIDFDINKIEKNGLNPCVMILVTNHNELGRMTIERYTEVNCLQKILSFSD